MSSRPRPVTATVTKPKWMGMPDAAGIAHARRHSLGSTGSTASLVSVLDHDSYISDHGDSEVESPKLRPVRKRSPKRHSMTKNVQKTQRGDDNSYSRHRSKSANNINCDDNNLTPWESWLIGKTKELRKKRQQEVQMKKQEKMKKTEKEREKEEKEIKACQVRSEWLEKKLHEDMLKKRMEKEKKQSEKRDKEEKERKIHEKSVSTFKSWMKDKREEERQRKRADKEKKRLEEEEKQMKKEEAERKFKEWLKSASKRPKSAPNSWGYLDGKLKGAPRNVGYHDTSAYPKPAYFNPEPWHPLHIPKVKSDKPKKTKPKKYVWNPKKYY